MYQVGWIHFYTLDLVPQYKIESGVPIFINFGGTVSSCPWLKFTCSNTLYSVVSTSGSNHWLFTSMEVTSGGLGKLLALDKQQLDRSILFSFDT